MKKVGGDDDGNCKKSVVVEMLFRLETLNWKADEYTKGKM
jgi:hypothetical protein